MSHKKRYLAGQVDKPHSPESRRDHSCICPPCTARCSRRPSPLAPGSASAASRTPRTCRTWSQSTAGAVPGVSEKMALRICIPETHRIASYDTHTTSHHKNSWKRCSNNSAVCQEKAKHDKKKQNEGNRTQLKTEKKTKTARSRTRNREIAHSKKKKKKNGTVRYTGDALIEAINVETGQHSSPCRRQPWNICGSFSLEIETKTFRTYNILHTWCCLYT